jgi:hypothetical protein
MSRIEDKPMAYRLFSEKDKLALPAPELLLIFAAECGIFPRVLLGEIAKHWRG